MAVSINGMYYSSIEGLEFISGGKERVNISTGGTITFKDENTDLYSFPTTSGATNDVLISDGSGALSFGPISQTNIYNTDGSLTTARKLTQSGNDLTISANTHTTAEIFNVCNNNDTANARPRFRVEANIAYDTVLELTASAKINLIEGYSQSNTNVFSVDGSGNLAATSKSFLIDHPTKEGYSLRYGSLEGPEYGVYIRGKLENGKTIELPDYWVKLVDSNTITVQLTPIGSHQNLYVKDIVDNTVIVGNSNLLNSKVMCFYFIQAERKDIDSMDVEFIK